VSAPHPDYEDVRCPACGLPICRNGEDEHNECVLVLAKERDGARQVARTLFGQLWEEWRFNSVREELEVMEKEFPWLKGQD
jgi:hypothetical protein